MKEDNYSRVGSFIIWGLTIAGLTVSYLCNPLKIRLLPPCLIRSTTGWYCPGCGMTRALHQLLHGHIFLAIRYNPFILLLAGGIGYFLVQSIRRVFLGWKGKSGNTVFWFWAILGLAVVFGIVRNIPIYPYTLLALP